jgi:mRNA-degrading endonuclease RelE of RelBE toxin-antitoxin system
MKKVDFSPAVDIATRSLDPDGRRRVQAWFDYLKRWDEDALVQKNSVPLKQVPGVYVLRTTTDIRIFFRIEGDTITVLDVAKTPAILASGGVGIFGNVEAATNPERNGK